MVSTKSSHTDRKHQAPDAITLLEKDHAHVRKLLTELEGTTPRGVKKRQQLLAELATEIRAHATIEEEIFYPAFHEAARTSEEEKQFYEATEEHALVHLVLPQLEETDASTDQFGARAKVLKDLIEHHAEEEETEMLPRSRKLLGRARLLELGAEMAARKEELLSSEPRAALPRRTGARSNGSKADSGASKKERKHATQRG